MGISKERIERLLIENGLGKDDDLTKENIIKAITATLIECIKTIQHETPKNVFETIGNEMRKKGL